MISIKEFEIMFRVEEISSLFDKTRKLYHKRYDDEKANYAYKRTLKELRNKLEDIKRQN